VHAPRPPLRESGRVGPAFARSRGVDPRVKPTTAHQYWPRWAALAWLSVGLLALCSVAACRRGVSDVDLSPNPVSADGTITGTVRGPGRTSPVEGRAVEVVNAATGQRLRATTNTAGRFSFKLPPGKYRVELALRQGESLVRQPGVIDLNRSDVDARADFVLGTVRVLRPRGPAYRLDDGLGSPVA
jgi:hypothetical protein